MTTIRGILSTTSQFSWEMHKSTVYYVSVVHVNVIVMSLSMMYLSYLLVNILLLLLLYKIRKKKYY